MTAASTPDFWAQFDTRASEMKSPSPFMRASGVAQAQGQTGEPAAQPTDNSFWGYLTGQAAPQNDMGLYKSYGKKLTRDIAWAVPRGVYGLADSITQGIYYTTGGLLGNDVREHPFGQAETLPGSFLETAAQVFLPYGVASRVVKGATSAAGLAGYGTAATAALGEESVIAAAAGNAGRARALAMLGRTIEVGKTGIQTAIAGGLADMVAFEKDAGRLSDLAMLSDNPMFNNTITQFLASDKEDSFLEAKLKHGLEGILVGGAVESAIGSFKVYRAGVRAVKLGQSPKAAMLAEHMNLRRQQREEIMGATGANPDEAEVINVLMDVTNIPRENLRFVRDTSTEVDAQGNPRRAAVTFKDDGAVVIKFFETADRSSPVHELSHVLRRRVLDRSIDPRYRAGVSDADIKVIEDAVGAKDGVFDVAAEERWADIFERYMWDGHAPNHQVAAVMERTSDFMRAVYTRLQGTNLDTRISPEVRRVMDKLMSRGPATVNETVAAVVKGNRTVMFGGLGSAFRQTMATLTEPLNPQESRQALESVYNEPTLYQSKKKSPFRNAEDNYPVKRGREDIVDRVRREVQQGKLPRERGDWMEKFINNMPGDLLDVMGVRFRKLPSGPYGATLGQFERGRDVVSMANEWVTQGVGKTWAHEWMHSMEGFLSDEAIASIKKDYERNYFRFVKQEGINPRAVEGTPEFAKVAAWLQKNPNRFNEFYAMTNLSEFKSMAMESAAYRQLDLQENTRSAIGFMRYALHNTLLNIKSLVDAGTMDRIAREMMDAKWRESRDRLANAMKDYGLGKFAPKPLLSEAGGNWQAILEKQVLNDEKWMFRDFEAAKSARSVGELKRESLLYRSMNRLDTTSESRAYPKGAEPRQVSTQTLYQSAQPEFSPEQLTWAKDTHVVNPGEPSKPLVVYHASKSPAPIRIFDKAKQTIGQFGKGFYFTGDAGRAPSYGPNVGAYILNMMKPFSTENDKNLKLLFEFENSLDRAQFGERPINANTPENWKSYLNDTRVSQRESANGFNDASMLVDVRMNLWGEEELGKFNEFLKSKGYDGIIGYHEGDIRQPEYVVFDENQIKDVSNKKPTSGPDTLYQSSQTTGQPPSQGPLQTPQGGQPPDRPMNIERIGSVPQLVQNMDIRLQVLEADGRADFASMTKDEIVQEATGVLQSLADFTGYRTLPELTDALRQDEDALRGVLARHQAMRMVLNEATDSVLRVRDQALQSNSPQDLARLVAMEQRLDALMAHTRQTQGQIARGLGSQTIIPTVGNANVRLIDDAILNDQQAVKDILDSVGGAEAVANRARQMQAAEAAHGAAGVARLVQGGNHGIWNMVTEYWMNSILSGPITFATNITSNTLAMLYLPAEQALGASLSRNWPLVRESLMRYSAMATEIKESMRYAGAVLKTGDNLLDAAAPNVLAGGGNRGRAISAAGIGANEDSIIGKGLNFIGYIVNAPTSALQGADEFYKQMNYRSTVKAGLMAEAMRQVAEGRLARDQMGQYVETAFQRMVDKGQFYSNTKVRLDAHAAAQAEIQAGKFAQGSTDHVAFVENYIKTNWDPSHGELANQARIVAREGTFSTPLRTDRPGLEGISAKVQNLVGQHPSLRILLPFIRTPTNLALFFGQRTPIAGIMHSTQGLHGVTSRLSRDLASGDAVRIAQARGRMAGGMLITGSALMMAGTGIITGSGPKDPERRRAMEKAGWMPYSIRIGNKYISYKKMDPFATFYGVVADLHEAYLEADEENRGYIEATLKGVVSAVANNLANKTYLTGIVSASNAISDAERYGGNWANTFVSSFVPSLLSQSKELVFDDPAMRDVQTLSEAIRNKIPGIAEGLRPKRDALGEAITTPRTMSALVPPSWPFAYRNSSSDIVDNEMAALGSGFTPPKPMRNDVDMRSFVGPNGQDAYDRWQQATSEVSLGGKTLRQSLEQLIQSDGYQRLDQTSAEDFDSPRIALIRRTIARYRDAALRQTLREFPDLMEAERRRRAVVIGARSGRPFADLLNYSRSQ